MNNNAEMGENPESIVNDIAKLQEEYYKQNNKNIFLKKNQKYECANIISQKLDYRILFEKTLFILKYGEIFFDYTRITFFTINIIHIHHNKKRKLVFVLSYKI